jgi:DNA-directed RNA polymerase subunit RPC12/RpoP
MPSYSLQLECLSCSNRRLFVRHSATGDQVLTQTDVATLSKGAAVTCGHCGSSSLIRSWADATPDATAPYIPRRRRRRSSHAVNVIAAV